ncbi:hypothetical protein G6F64_009428 [Rhizopus arrhizus]|uniref:FAD/NAD(P)-binding domain-containing protein n=1 Tax=Rhizopus oryzae TaxID=64495 RepID=A0A9P6X2Y4_RHIOR|nr:hypothetical protein G6F64_009428 [Rhizopus arrhizus]
MFAVLSSTISNLLGKNQVAVIEPSNKHYHQPLWTYVGITTFDPENNTLRLADGQTVGYDYLIVAAGGNALFTFPTTPLKCPGAPTKITFLAEEVFRLTGVRDKTNVIYNHGGTQIFGIEYFAHAIEKLADERGIKRNFYTNYKNGELKTFEYDFIHIAPPQGPPNFIKESKLVDANGWVDVNKDTLRHNKYSNVFALGDCSSLPTSKIADLQGKKVEQAVYDGYSSCPMIFSRDRLILAEYSGYTSMPLETFSFDQRKLSKVSQYLNKEIGRPQV